LHYKEVSNLWFQESWQDCHVQDAFLVKMNSEQMLFEINHQASQLGVNHNLKFAWLGCSCNVPCNALS
jgi:hypothetical protein